MDKLSFSQGESFLLDGERYEVFRSLDPQRVQIEEAHTGEITTQSREELLQAYVEGRLIGCSLNGTPEVQLKPLPLDLDHVRSSKAKVEGLWNQEVLTITRRVVGKITRANLKYFGSELIQKLKAKAAEFMASLRGNGGQAPLEQPPQVPQLESIYKLHLKVERANGDPMAAVPRHGDKGGRAPRISAEALDLMDRLIRDRYLTPARPTMRQVHELLRAEIRGHNKAAPKDAQLAEPHYETFRRRIRAISAFEICLHRYGAEVAKRRFKYRGVGEPTLRIQQRYEIDHVRLDVIAIDARTRIPLGRPWLTIVIDKHSRMVVGYYIGFNAPSAYSVMRALACAFMPKTALLKRFPEVKGAWPCWGETEEIVTDNGVELHSEPLRRACMELGITLTFCGSKDPQGKGTIERFFRTLSLQLIHLLPGTTRSNHNQRSSENVQVNAKITLDELEKVIVKYIVDVYSRSHHEGLKSTPIEVWEMSATLHPPRLTGDVNRLRRSLAITRIVRLTERGITIEGLRFSAPELARLLRKAKLSDATPNVIVKLDPDDLSHVQAALVGAKSYLTVPNLHPDYTQGLSLIQHRAIVVHNKKAKRTMDVDQLLQSKLELQAMVDALYAKRRSGSASKVSRELREAARLAMAAVAPTPKRSGGAKDLDADVSRYLVETAAQAQEDGHSGFEVIYLSSRRKPKQARAGGAQ